MADDSDKPPKQPSATTDESKLAAPASAVELPPEVLSQLPGPLQQHFGMFSATATMGPARSGPDRLLERIPEGQAAEVVGRIVSHADKVLELQHTERMAQIQARERQHVHGVSTEDRRQGRALWFASFVVLLGMLVAVYCL